MIAPPFAKISRQNSATSSVRYSPLRSADRELMSPPVLIQKFRRQLSATASSTLQAASINSGALPSPLKIPTTKGRAPGLKSIRWLVTGAESITKACYEQDSPSRIKEAYNFSAVDTARFLEIRFLKRTEKFLASRKRSPRNDVRSL